MSVLGRLLPVDVASSRPKAALPSIFAIVHLSTGFERSEDSWQRRARSQAEPRASAGTTSLKLPFARKEFECVHRVGNSFPVELLQAWRAELLRTSSLS